MALRSLPATTAVDGSAACTIRRPATSPPSEVLDPVSKNRSGSGSRPSSRSASWYASYRSARSACAGWPANPIRRCPCAYRWATACCTPARLSGATAGTSSAGDWWLASTIGIPVACRSARYSGVTAAVTPEYLADLHATGMPIVLASHQSPGLDVPAVAPDNRAGVQQAVAHLYAHGHRRIGFAGHPLPCDTLHMLRHAG